MKVSYYYIGFCFSILFAQDTLQVSDQYIFYNSPNPVYWKSQGHTFEPDREVGYVIFKHIPLMDSLDQIIEPVISIVYEHTNNDSDVVLYSAEKRSRMRIKWSVDSVRTADGFSCAYSNGIVYNAYYYIEDVRHPALIGHFLGNDLGIQIVGEATESVYGMVRRDMENFIRSFNIINVEK